MKSYSKWIIMMIVAIFAISMVGCAPTPAATDVPPQPTDLPKPTDAPKPTATSVPEPTATLAPEPVTIRYANWNVGTEEENNKWRQQVALYVAANPHVTIEFVDMSAEGGWEANLTAYAAKGELPDVFMANNVPLYVQNGWVADLSALTSADPEWALVPQFMKDAFTYGGKVYGLPADQFLMGYWVNIDLYEAANLDAPMYGVSAEEFLAAAEALNNPAKGILGLDEQEFILGWYPNAIDPNLAWFSFDGQHMNYNSAAFKEAIVKFAEIKPLTWQGLSDEQKVNFKSAGPWELFANQEVGVRWDATWAIDGYLAQTFNWDFIGIPGGNQATVLDVMAVSSQSKNLEEAYKFAKFMTFSKEGWMAEVAVVKAIGSGAPTLPIVTDDEVLAAYEEFIDVPGLLTALDNLDNSIVESLAKIVPGYVNARWEGKPGIDIDETDKDVNMWYMFNFSDSGKYKYEDYAAQLEEFANRILDEAAAALPK